MNFYTKYLEEIGEKTYRIQQIDQAIYKDLVENFEDISTLSKDLRENLSKKFQVLQLKVLEEKKSKDGTQKVLFETFGGEKIESVLMRHRDNRNTVCVSSQVGCAQACTFCATGKMGLKKNLSADEIISQVLYFSQKLQKEEGQKVNNIVFMGMGEPFHNYEEVLNAIWQMHNQKKLNLGGRHITVSTSGVIPDIEKFMKEDLQLNLAVSIHAGTNETRSKIMPVNKLYPIEKLLEILKKYTRKAKRKIFYEYVMLKGVNDMENEAESLGKLLRGEMAHINIIPYNPGGKDEYSCSEKETMWKFQKIFDKYEIPSTIRVTLGQDIDGACGQLATK